MKKISIIGAGGHTRTLINILSAIGIHVGTIYDENTRSDAEQILGIPVLQLDAISKADLAIISKGNVSDKVLYTQKFLEHLMDDNIIHPKALVETVKIGLFNQISPLVYISNTSIIGNHNIVYSGSVIEHESEIGDFNIITVNVSICGRVKIGNRCYLGAGCVILPNVSISDDVIIGAGAVVTKNILTKGTYVGTPAKNIEL